MREFLFLSILVFFSTAPLMAQMSAAPPEVGAKIREMGKSFSNEAIETVMKLYMPLHGDADRRGVNVTKDVKYGIDERHRLDVYEPSKKTSRSMPILVFVHGGGFVGGNKSAAGTPFYGNIGCYFARRGIVTIIPTYRLAPAHKWPAGTEDVAGALGWIRKNAEKFGGDAAKIFLMGHSAGAAHVATYVFQEEFQLKDGDGVSGAILVSGIYDPGASSSPAYYGEDTSEYPSMASMQHIDGRKIPVFIVFAELDPYIFDVQASGLFQALCQRDKACPAIKQLIGHNHLSEIYHINTADESLGPDILEFIRTRSR